MMGKKAGLEKLISLQAIYFWMDYFAQIDLEKCNLKVNVKIWKRGGKGCEFLENNGGPSEEATQNINSTL